MSQLKSFILDNNTDNMNENKSIANDQNDDILYMNSNSEDQEIVLHLFDQATSRQLTSLHQTFRDR